MNLAASALRRPFTVLVAAIAIVLGTGLALDRMPRDVFPPLGIPTIYVAQPYGGMDPAQMESFLTYFYEYHFLYISGIEHVESKSIQGAALLKLQFHPGTDMSQAMAETVSYANRARSFMPPGTVPPFVMRFDAGSVPVGYLVFSSQTRSLGEMQDVALNRVRPMFATLPGVSAPPPFGGSARSILINLNPSRLRAYNISPAEVVTALTRANLISPSGNIRLQGKYPTVPLNSVVRDIQTLEDVPIRTGVYPTVFLRDVGQVVDGADIVTSYALANGRKTVYIPVTKRSNASTLAVVKLVKKNLRRFQSVLPPDVTVSYVFDQSPYVTRAINGLSLEAALGAVLTGLMILLFLQDWRSAFVVVINIPLSLMAAVMALWLTGQTVNLMTLGGLTLAVGILVDEATVCIENIHTHLTRGKPLARAVLDATSETTGPRLLAMLCIVAMFTPALFMVGAAKALFTPLALAVGFSMIASYFLSATLVPILSIWLLRGHEQAVEGPPKDQGLFARFQGWFTGLLRRVVNRRWTMLAVYLVAAGAVIILVGRRVGTNIFPPVEADQLQVRLRAPPGTQIEGTAALAVRTLDLIKAEVGPKNVEVTLGFVGVHGSAYPVNFIYLWDGGPEEGVVQVQLRPGTPIGMDDLKERLRRVFAREMPQVHFSFEPSDIVSRVMSLGSPTPIEVAVSGPDLQTDRAFAERVKVPLSQMPDLRDVQFDQDLNYPTVNVDLDRERAGLMGVTMADVSRSLVTATASSRFVVPNYWADPHSGIAYQIQVQVPQTKMTSLEQLRDVPVLQRQGRAILLRNVAKIRRGTDVGQYERYNMRPMVTISANIAHTDLGTAARQVAQALKGLGTPPHGVSVAVRGQVVPMDQMIAGLRTGLLLIVVAIFLLLAANFQSLKLSVAVVSTIPAVIAGVLVMVKLTGSTLNLESFIGAIMAIGVAVANAILLVTFAERARMGLSARTPAPDEPIQPLTAAEAAVEAARSRLRPILMTSLAMIAGMVPMALGLGEGGGQTAPLGRAVIGGLAVATFATLLVLPAVFALLQARAHRRPVSLNPDDTQRAIAEAG